jgi:photosystem II stability/assembly factor-like uncharacterized protein
MKIKILIISFMFSLSGILNAQWIIQYPYTAGVGLRDIEFINENTGWICGDYTILKTTNAGLNWISQTHPAPDKYLYGIHPVDSNVVYCVGWFETVLKTTDGGNNWFALKNGPVGQGYSYESLFFINQQTGWYSGWGNHIYKTTNGGISFDSVYMLGTFKDMHFKDENTGLITGGGGSVFKTTNAGLNWYQIYLQPNNYGDFRKISVINNQYCFVVEDGKRVYKSTNYGDTWDSIGYVTGADQPYSCRFSSLQTGWVCGTYGEIFKSTNGGATWSFQYVNTTNIGWLRSFWFHNDNTGWAVGGNTKLLYTSTGGATFVNSSGNNIPNDFILFQNYPNPFNNETVITYSLPRRSNIQIIIYDILGRKVDELFNGIKNSGTYSETYNASKLSSGIYFIKMICDNNIQKTKSMLLIK